MCQWVISTCPVILTFSSGAIFNVSVYCGDLVVPATRTARYGPRSFAVAGPSTWNSLPASLRDYRYIYSLVTYSDIFLPPTEDSLVQQSILHTSMLVTVFFPLLERVNTTIPYINIDISAAIKLLLAHFICQYQILNCYGHPACLTAIMFCFVILGMNFVKKYVKG